MQRYISSFYSFTQNNEVGYNKTVQDDKQLFSSDKFVSPDQKVH